MARAAPKSSSAVSPLAARAAMKAPIWALVMEPEKMADIMAAMVSEVRSFPSIMVVRCRLKSNCHAVPLIKVSDEAVCPPMSL